MSQPQLYRKPATPGYLGGYNWPAVALGLLVLVLANFFCTQYIANRFQYQPALGPPLRAPARRRHLSTLRLGHLGLAAYDRSGPRHPHALFTGHAHPGRRKLSLCRRLLRHDQPAGPAALAERRSICMAPPAGPRRPTSSPAAC